MLNTMRGSGNSKVMWIIMGLLMLGLTGFGIGGLSGGTIRTIGAVGEEPIEIAPYATGLQNAIARQNQQAGRALSPSEVRESGVQTQVLDAVVGIAALNNEVAAKGLSVGDEAVRDTLMASTQFTGIDGSFDRERYEFFLDRQLGITPAEYESLLRKQNTRAILESAVVGGVQSDGASARVLLDFARQERSAEWAELTAETLAEPIADPTAAELAAFYEANADSYRTPLTRRITYAWLDPAALIDSIELSEEDLRAAYADQSERFNQPERRAVDRLVYPSLAAAQEARERFDAGEASFTDLVEARGLGETDITMGEVERGDLATAAADAVFAAQGPGVIGPVESALGPALFRINAVLSASRVPFEEAEPELRDELAGEAARREVNAMVTELDDMLAAGATLEELGADTPMTHATIAYNDATSEAIAGYPAFRSAAEAAAEGDFPELIDLEDGGVVALRLDGIEAPAPIPLDEIRDRVTADWRAEQLMAALRDRAAAFVAQIEAGSEPEALIWNVEETMTRTSFIDDLPPATVTEVFALDARGDIAVLDGAERVILVRLTDITPFDTTTEEAAALLDTIRTRMDAGVALDMLDLFSRAVQDRAKVTLNQAAINQVNNQILGLQ